MTGRAALAAFTLAVWATSSSATSSSAMPAGRPQTAARAALLDHLENLARLQVAARNCRDAGLPAIENVVRVVGANAVGFGLMSNDALVAALDAEAAREQARVGQRCERLGPKLARADRTHRRLMAAFRRLPLPP